MVSLNALMQSDRFCAAGLQVRLGLPEVLAQHDVCERCVWARAVPQVPSVVAALLQKHLISFEGIVASAPLCFRV